MEQLRDELTDLEARVQRVGSRLRAMESDREQVPAQTPARTAPQRQAPPTPGRTLGDWIDGRTARRPRAERSGSKLIAWTGGLITLVGLVLALALAIQRGYLGPGPRVLAGLVLSAVLIGAALRLHRTPAGRPGAYALAATGIAGIYLDVIAASAMYGFVPHYAGLLIGFAVAVAGLGLAGYWNSQFLACFVVLGCAACAPVLTEGLTLLLAGFLLVLKAASTPVQLVRSWPGLAVAAALPALAVSIVAGGLWPDNRPGPTVALALATFLLVGTGAVLAARRRPSDATAYALLVAAPVPALIAVPLLPTALGAGLAATVAVANTVLWRGRAWLPARFTRVAGAVTALTVLHASATFTGGTGRTALLLAEALLLCAVALWLRSARTLLAAVLYGCAGWLLVLVSDCEPGSLTGFSAAPPPADLVDSLLAGTLGTVVAGALVLTGHRIGVLPTPAEAPLRWLAAALGVLYGSAAAVLNAVLLASPTSTGFLTGHVLITLGWTAAGLILLLRAGGSAVLRVGGLLLAGAAVAKLGLFDLSTLDGLARVAVALGAGLALLVVGARYARS